MLDGHHPRLTLPKKVDDCVKLHKMELVGRRRLDRVFVEDDLMPSEQSAASCMTQDRLLYASQAVHDRVYIPQPWDSKTQHVMHDMSLMQQLGWEVRVCVWGPEG